MSVTPRGLPPGAGTQGTGNNLLPAEGILRRNKYINADYNIYHSSLFSVNPRSDCRVPAGKDPEVQETPGSTQAPKGGSPCLLALRARKQLGI